MRLLNNKESRDCLIKLMILEIQRKKKSGKGK